jgi:outer membrane protein OmpA-like peptidoglycan-associated protein
MGCLGAAPEAVFFERRRLRGDAGGQRDAERRPLAEAAGGGDASAQHLDEALDDIEAESDEILTNTIVIHFFPNSWDLNKQITKEVDGKSEEVPYDPNVKNVLEEVAKLAGQFGAARIIVEGHTDSSREGQVPESLIKELSENRANAVREALVNKFKMDPNRFAARGMGWERPADPNDRKNHAKNRRVEIKVFAAEKQ